MIADPVVLNVQQALQSVLREMAGMPRYSERFEQAHRQAELLRTVLREREKQAA